VRRTSPCKRRTCWIRTRRVSRLLAKTRRDNWHTHREWRIYGVEDSDPGRGILPWVRPEGDGRVERPTYLSTSVFTARRGGNALGSPPSLVHRPFIATREPAGLSPHLGQQAWAVTEAGRDRVAVVVVGVTPHQGIRESLIQGEGPQVKACQAAGYRGTRPHGRPTRSPAHRCASIDSPSLASRMPRRVACPVLRALGGDVPPQCGNAPSFDPISTDWIGL
jgi:hypothetical protein